MSMTFPVRRSSTPTPDERREAVLENPSFGTSFTDHMARATWTADAGWHDDRIGPLEEYSLHPAAAVLHYAQEIFEGLKAYRHPGGRVALFRPDRNAARLARSAERLVMPRLDPEDFLRSVTELVRADADWVPDGAGASLYLRPFLFASEAFLGVRPARRFDYSVVASPAGAYFASGDVGISLWVSTTHSRAGRGGTGAAKCGGNYASSLIAQVEAAERGCDQVLFTGGDPGDPLVEEAGTMNVFAVTRDGRLLTPGLGTILEGITRDSVLALAAEHGLRAEVADMRLASLLDGCRSGEITELFAAGTAAVITPITRVCGESDPAGITVGEGTAGAATVALRDHLVGIQLGERPDPRGWVRYVD